MIQTLLTILVFLPFFFSSVTSSTAQELPPPQQQDSGSGESAQTAPQPGGNEVAVDDFISNPELPFTGTLAEDDPENIEMMEKLEEEKELFGEDDEIDEEISEIETGSHILKFEFTSRAQFLKHEVSPEGAVVTGEPYMEIEYKTHFEIPVTLTDKRKRENTEAEYEIQNWGSLAKNEFFDCRLDIAIQEVPVEIVTRVQSINNEDETVVEQPDLALKIAFNKNAREDWFSFCTDITGATLNTQGDTEDYNLQIIDLIEPSLSAIVVENFDATDKTSIDLTATPKTINDTEIDDDIILSGDGEITVDPI